MATVDELLNRQKNRLQKMSEVDTTAPVQEPRKKIKRTGATRPWQENLPKYQTPIPPHSEELPTHKPESYFLEKKEKKLSQSEVKLEPKLSQSEVKPEPKLSQSEIKLEPKFSSYSKSEAKVEPQPRPQLEPKLSQSEAKVEPNDAFSSLVGLQRNALLYIFDSCRFRGSKVSGPIVIQNLATPLNSTPAAIRKAIQRLEQKGCLQRVGYKDGRGGWTEYKVTDDIYGALLIDKSRAKVEPNISQSRAKVEPQLRPQLEPSLPSSSSININTTTTRTQNLEEIQIPPILKEKGFGLSHLKQILGRHEFSIEEIQGFLEGYAFDLQSDQGKKLEARGTNLIGYFFGALKNGGYNTLSKDFKTAEDQAREDQLKALEERKRIREDQEKRIFELKFAEWLDTKGKEELVKLVPPMGEYLGAIHRSGLKDFFKENILDNQEN